MPEMTAKDYLAHLLTLPGVIDVRTAEEMLAGAQAASTLRKLARVLIRYPRIERAIRTADTEAEEAVDELYACVERTPSAKR